MEDLIDIDEIVKSIEMIKSDLVKIDSTDAIEVYSILDAIIRTFDDIKQGVSMKIWREYVELNPEIDEMAFVKKYLKKLEG